MRTKKAERVTRFDVIGLEPKPALYISYDGLGKLSERSLLRDVLEELQRKGAPAYTEFLKSLRSHRSAYVHVYFSDYVSYGIGGGDATAEFFFGTYLLLHDAATGGESGSREALTLVHPAVRPERVELAEA
ncbi:MAG: hypothetical protein KGJ23_14210 [Euryarchaeota archaeon]|nr:hypothetical protein [Euryarchaeota archaeon]MDE1837753.1 hypothetical protein [Euryarchaeota archaeon]MDE1881139.1 hypothetical protein [Euryarchaeota archaeon]MDE2045425.1 hypothetical protein [Thermoplasmata archaeon]